MSNWEFFVWNWEKTILFGIGNGAEFRPQKNSAPKSGNREPWNMKGIFQESGDIFRNVAYFIILVQNALTQVSCKMSSNIT